MSIRSLDRYEVLGRVAAGGQGEVLRARDDAGAPVAVKVRTGDAALQEAQQLRHLKPHACLPLIREVVEQGDQTLIVTSWVQGQNLAEVLGDEGRPGLPFARALGLLEQIASALDHLHAHVPPIVHGDIKPANIIVGDDGSVVVVDLGSATRHPRPAGGGTPGFMAPEGPSSPAADVYSLAATTYALLTGVPPQPGMRTRWTHLPPRAARRVEMALRRGLSYDPSRRPARASDLVAALRPATTKGETAESNLPTTLGPLFGRSGEVRELCRVVDASRLVTVTGRGGVGKTRLAQEASHRLVSRFPDGVFWVEATSGVAGTLAAILGLAVPPDTDAAEVLVRALSDKRALLVIDGSEDVVHVVGPLLRTLLDGCPDLRVLATSRRPLQVTGERVHSLASLAIGGRSPALDLFWEHASPSLARRGRAARTAAEICRLVDGVPLAVELAATRTRTNPLNDVLHSLRNRGPVEDPVAEAISWSMSLLDDGDRTLLRRLGVFRGGADVDAVLDVCAVSPQERAETQQRLWRLASLALVEVEEADGRVRYRLHDTVRAVAGGPHDDRLEERFTRWFAQTAPSLRGAALEREHENLAEAVRVAERAHDAQLLHTLAGRLWFGWIRAGRLREAESLLVTALERGDPPAAVHHGAGALANHRGDWQTAITHLQRAIEGYEAAGDARRATEARGDLLRPLQSTGQHEAYREAVARNAAESQRLGDDGSLAASADEQAWLAFDNDEPERAAELFDDATELYRKINDPYRLHLALRGRSIVAMQQGRYDDSRRALTEATAIEREIGDHLAYATSTMELGFLSAYDGSPIPEAERLLREALRAFRRMGHALGQGTALHGLGQCAYKVGRLEEADELLQRSLERTKEGGMPSSIGSVTRSLAHVAYLRGRRGECARHLLDAMDIYTQLVEAEYDTVNLLEQAAALGATGHAAEAAALLGFIDAWNAERGIPVPDDPAPDDPRTLARLALGDAYNSATASGRTLAFADAAARGRALLENLARD